MGNFPLSPRIQTLLLARNRVSSIQHNLPNSIPNLKNLVLTANSLSELADLDVLGKFAQLTHLVLAENPVARKEVRLFLLPVHHEVDLTFDYSITGTGSSCDALHFVF